jgi:hypothetical protein
VVVDPAVVAAVAALVVVAAVVSGTIDWLSTLIALLMAGLISSWTGAALAQAHAQDSGPV